MNTQKSKLKFKLFFTKEVKIGIIALVCLLLLFFGFNYLKGVNLLKPSNYIFASFEEVSGLSVSTPVYINGYKVGVVREVTYNYEENKNFKVEIGMDSKIRLPKGSKIVMEKGLMGGVDMHVDLAPDQGDYEPKGATLQGVISAGLIGDLQDKVVAQVGDIMPKLDSILTGINRLVNDPSLSKSLHNIETTSSQLAVTTATLNAMLKNDLQPTFANVHKISDDVAVITADVRSMPLKSMVANMDVTIRNLQTMSHQMNSKDNTVGLLLNDRSLYDNLNNTVGNANALMVDLKSNPKRYVHFSIWGGK